MDDKQFDRLINEALKNFQADHVPSNWDEFEHQLDQELDQDWTEFDQAIRDKVKNFTVPYHPDYWQTFDSKLEHSLHKDYATELDANVKSKLDNYQVAYDESTWPILERKIEERKAYIRRLIFTKSIEAAIVIFAIFTFYTYFPHFHQQFKNWKNSKQESFVVQESPGLHHNQSEVTGIGQEDIRSSEDSDAQIFAYRTESSTENQTELVANHTAISKADLTTAKATEVPSAPAYIDQTSTGSFTGNSVDAFNRNRQRYSSATLPSADISVSGNKIYSSPDLSYETTESSRVALAEVKKTLNKKPKFDRKALVRPLEPGKDIAFASLHNETRSVAFNSFQNAKKKGIWSLGIYGSADLNYINIPQDEYVDFEQRTFEFREKDLAEVGFGTGLSVNFRLGALSFETGINYAYKKYDPNKNYSPAEGFSEINYKRIHMDIVEVPINVQYRWDNEGRLKVYGVAGAAVNAIAVSDHDLVIPRPSLRGHTRSSSENFEVLRVKSHFLKGDDARETFYTINLGMGVEYCLSEHYTLFAEPLYKQQFLTKGIGPNQDKINTLSLKLGSRMSF